MTADRKISVDRFVKQEGRRLPIHHRMIGPSFEGDERRSVERITLDGEAFAQLGVLYLEVHIEARIVQPCDRCLTPVTSTVVIEEPFEVVIPPGVQTVDLWDPALHLVLSAQDPYVLCTPDCRGLCPTCGVDLNENPDHECTSSDMERSTLGDHFQ